MDKLTPEVVRARVDNIRRVGKVRVVQYHTVRGGMEVRGHTPLFYEPAHSSYRFVSDIALFYSLCMHWINTCKMNALTKPPCKCSLSSFADTGVYAHTQQKEEKKESKMVNWWSMAVVAVQAYMILRASAPVKVAFWVTLTWVQEEYHATLSPLDKKTEANYSLNPAPLRLTFSSEQTAH